MTTQQFREFCRAMGDGFGWVSTEEIEVQLAKGELTESEVIWLKAILTARAQYGHQLTADAP